MADKEHDGSDERGVGFRNAFCSFCRKSYRDVGLLVEGPPLVVEPNQPFICYPCIQLCAAIIEEERRRRGIATGDCGPAADLVENLSEARIHIERAKGSTKLEPGTANDVVEHLDEAAVHIERAETWARP